MIDRLVAALCSIEYEFLIAGEAKKQYGHSYITVTSGMLPAQIKSI